MQLVDGLPAVVVGLHLCGGEFRTVHLSLRAVVRNPEGGVSPSDGAEAKGKGEAGGTSGSWLGDGHRPTAGCPISTRAES